MAASPYRRRDRGTRPQVTRAPGQKAATGHARECPEGSGVEAHTILHQNGNLQRPQRQQAKATRSQGYYIVGQAQEAEAEDDRGAGGGKRATVTRRGIAFRKCYGKGSNFFPEVV
jgi:hypothetical protein